MGLAVSNSQQEQRFFPDSPGWSAASDNCTEILAGRNVIRTFLKTPLNELMPKSGRSSESCNWVSVEQRVVGASWVESTETDCSPLDWKEELQDLKKLSADWDFEGAQAPDPKVLEKADRLLNYLGGLSGKLSDLYPNPSGTVSLYFTAHGSELEIELGHSTMSYYVAKPGVATQYNDNCPYSEFEFKRLQEALTQL